MRRTERIVVDHDFYCTRCARKGIPVCRTGNNREAGHLKLLYCMYCKCEINHAECVDGTKYDYSLFLQEWKSGNFNMDGTRKLPFSEWKSTHHGELSMLQEADNLSLDDWREFFKAEAKGY